MARLDPRPGGRYLTASGAPVQVLEMRDGLMVLQGLASDNRFSVPGTYPLEPLRATAVFDLRREPYVPRAARIQQTRTSQAVKQLAPLIDAMLITGNKTMRGIVRDLRRRASVACRGRDVRANIRARIYWLKKKGLNVSIK